MPPEQIFIRPVLPCKHMETNDERRRKKLTALCGEYELRDLAEKAGLKWEGLDQVIKMTKLPKKADGTRAARGLGDPAARAIEDALGLGRGWFDWPLNAVDYKQYWSLLPEQRGHVQIVMQQAISHFLENNALPPEPVEFITFGLARSPKTKPVKKKSA
jgi:hypothetical protein